MSKGPLLLNTGPSEAGWHRLENVLRCPRLFALKEQQATLCEQTDVPPEKMSKTPLVRGSLVHQGLAQHYLRLKAVQDGKDENGIMDPLSGIQAAAERQPDSIRDVWVKHTDEAKKLVAAYITFWGRDKHWEILEVEKEYRGYIKDEEFDRKYLYTGRADLVIKDKRDDKVYILDHKTTYAIIGKTVKRYTLSGQMLGYQLFGAKKYGDNFGGIILNMLCTTKKDNVNYDFKRHPLGLAPLAVKTFKQTIIEAERRIHHYKEKDLPPMEWPGVFSEQICWTGYGPCDMQDMCRWGF